MALKKAEDKVMYPRHLATLQSNPSESFIKTTKAITQEFMMSPNFVHNGRVYEPAQKHLGCGVYQISYKWLGSAQIKV